MIRFAAAWFIALAIAICTGVVVASVVLAPPSFTHLAPGNLTPGSGTGRVDGKIYQPELAVSLGDVSRIRELTGVGGWRRLRSQGLGMSQFELFLPLA